MCTEKISREEKRETESTPRTKKDTRNPRQKENGRKDAPTGQRHSERDDLRRKHRRAPRMRKNPELCRSDLNPYHTWTV